MINDNVSRRATKATLQANEYDLPPLTARCSHDSCDWTIDGWPAAQVEPRSAAADSFLSRRLNS